jgi:Flp pilus assembly protein TadG
MNWISIFRDLKQDRAGNVAMIAALAAIPLVGAGGLAIDYTRALQFKTSLQGACDSAALAGASLVDTSASQGSTMATSYITSEITKLPPNNGVTYSVTTPGNDTVQVVATAKVPTTFMAMFTKSFNVTTTSLAGPAYGSGSAVGTQMNVSFSAGAFSASAADANTIYWYIVPTDGSVPPSSALNALWTNDTKNPVPSPASSYQVGSNQKIGFAMKNVTGGLSNYGSNQYGGTAGSTHMFYSSQSPPSTVAYPGEGQNNVKVCTSGTESNCEQHGSVSTSSNAMPSCAAMGNATYTYAWNDMGGSTDDLDYNDAVYQISCSSTTSQSQSCFGWNCPSGGGTGGSTSNPAAVVLIK